MCDGRDGNRSPRPRRRAGLSIQSILLIMLLLVSITSNVVVGIIGYLNGTESLRTAAIDRLVEVRDSRAREIVRLFESIENSLCSPCTPSRASRHSQRACATSAGFRLDAVEAAGGEARRL